MVTRMVRRAITGRLILPFFVLPSTGCNIAERTESVLTFIGEETTEEDILASISARLEDVLKPQGFTCESHETLESRGHTVWYSTCRIVDHSNPLQGTQTWVTLKFPNDSGSARLEVHTGHVTLHPFTPSHKYFKKWAELVEATVCEFQDFDVDHSWPADSEYPISC